MENRRGGRVVDGKDGVGRPLVLVFLAAIGEGQQRFTQQALTSSALALIFFVLDRADDEARGDAQHEILEQRARELGAVVHHEQVGDPVRRAGGHLQHDRAASAAVSVERVGTAWTLPEKCPTCTCTWSKPAAVIGRPSSDHAASPPRREGSGRGWGRPRGARVVGLGALADLTGPHVGDDVARLPRSVGEPADEGSRLVATKGSTEGRGTPAGYGPSFPPIRRTQSIGIPLHPAVEQAAVNDEGFAWPFGVWRAPPGDHGMGPKKGSVGSSWIHVATKPAGHGWEGR